MIRIYEIEAGDTVILRNGGKMEVTKNSRGTVFCGGIAKSHWNSIGDWNMCGMRKEGEDHCFDIVGIEKKPTRIVKIFIGADFDKSVAHANTQNFFAERYTEIYEVICTEDGTPTIARIQTCS